MFNCISNTKAAVTDFAYSTNKSNIGVCPVPDERLANIDTFIKADKLIYATLDVVDIPADHWFGNDSDLADVCNQEP